MSTHILKTRLFQGIIAILLLGGLFVSSFYLRPKADIPGGSPSASPNPCPVYKISGKVITQNNTPIGGSTVTITKGPVTKEVTADSSGKYILSGLPNGDYYLVAKGAISTIKLESDEVKVTITNADVTQDITMLLLTDVDFTVKYSNPGQPNDNSPVPSGTVTASGDTMPKSQPIVQGFSRIQLKATKNYSVIATDQNGKSSASTNFTVGPSTLSQTLIIDLTAKQSRIWGYTTYGGNPIAPNLIKAYPANPMSIVSSSVGAFNGSVIQEGNRWKYNIPVPVSGRYIVHVAVNSGGFLSKYSEAKIIDVPDAREVQQDLTLYDQKIVIGSFNANHHRMSIIVKNSDGVEVSAAGSADMTFTVGANGFLVAGNYTITFTDVKSKTIPIQITNSGLNMGVVDIRDIISNAFWQGYIARTFAQFVPSVLAQTTAPTSTSSSALGAPAPSKGPCGTISGSIVDENGKNITNAPVDLKVVTADTDQLTQGPTRVNSSGDFSFTGLSVNLTGDTQYKVKIAQADGFSYDANAVTPDVVTLNKDLSPPYAFSPVKIKLKKKALGLITGQIEDYSGAVITNKTAVVHLLKGDGGEIGNGYDSNKTVNQGGSGTGKFEFKDIPLEPAGLDQYSFQVKATQFDGGFIFKTETDPLSISLNKDNSFAITDSTKVKVKIQSTKATLEGDVKSGDNQTGQGTLVDNEFLKRYDGDPIDVFVQIPSKGIKATTRAVNGHYKFDESAKLQAGDAKVQVNNNLFKPFDKSVTLNAGPNTADIDLAMEEENMITGQVRNPDRFPAPAGVTIRVYTSASINDRPTSELVTMTTSTPNDGLFVMKSKEFVKNKTFFVEVWSGPGDNAKIIGLTQQVSFTRARGEVKNIPLTLLKNSAKRDYNVLLTTYKPLYESTSNAYEPIGNVDVTLSAPGYTKTLTTDKSGGVIFKNVPEGKVTYMAKKEPNYNQSTGDFTLAGNMQDPVKVSVVLSPVSSNCTNYTEAKSVAKFWLCGDQAKKLAVSQPQKLALVDQIISTNKENPHSPEQVIVSSNQALTVVTSGLIGITGCPALDSSIVRPGVVVSITMSARFLSDKTITDNTIQHVITHETGHANSIGRTNCKGFSSALEPFASLFKQGTSPSFDRAAYLESFNEPDYDKGGYGYTSESFVDNEYSSEEVYASAYHIGSLHKGEYPKYFSTTPQAIKDILAKLVPATIQATKPK